MRTPAILILAITAAAFASNPTVAKVKRIEFIPEIYQGIMGSKRRSLRESSHVDDLSVSYDLY